MKGERFSNEAGTFQTWKSGPRYYTIWSDDFFREVEKNGLPVSFGDDLTCQGGIDAGKPLPVDELINLCVEKGIAYKGDTLEDLAKQLSQPFYRIISTVALRLRLAAMKNSAKRLIS
ncbi:MAG: hypothetical protein ACLSA6_13105 [Holdemania massiliensis]